ncbi:glycosyltransferase [Desulfopila sp. IMCC35008]|uniref:glycosyltransferase family 2 protein n=1 Tax=Desulfopila sp. IMCC35008 TaxID=2653858 RepID=UPI0013D7E115|nr:glycosyltransferase [Desulfopila sp. IMCC35008]
MTNPLVSVVIPAYNHEKFIGAAIESVLQQTCSDLELIVIDDGSTDKTGEIVKSYTDSRLSYTWQENQDAFNTINRGMGEAKGKFIAILNSDDVYTTDRLEKILAHQGDTGAECIFTDVTPISDEGEDFSDPNFGWNLWHQGNRKVYQECGDLYTSFLHGNFMVTTSNLFMTAEAMKKVGNFCSLRYLHDYDYMFRMLLAHPQGVHYMVNDKLLYYRIHSGNTLGEAAIKGRLQDQDLILKYMLARIPEELKSYVETGSARLVELERELNEVRQLLEPEHKSIGVRPAGRELINSLNVWVKKKIGG